ncbi:NAD(P)H-dependent glycerol-3-phosphate dehydrogenase, partial [Candidatus Aerophobetes bacterium]|nr:NAD(P)H-dependent glycerol-3-phosphate dehydrogenase [Candidatus Aerophobetes bacterium]
MSEPISVLGMGMFGFVLSRHLALKYPGKKILVYDKEEKIIKSLLEEKNHPLHFQEYAIPDNITPTNDLEKVVTLSQIIVIAIPTQKMRDAAKDLEKYVKKNTLLLNVAKGLEINTGKRVSQILKEEIHKSYFYAVLSGGTIAGEMIKGHPVAAEIACTHATRAKKLQEFFSTKKFRLYGNDDVVGVEVAGALKNPLSIASGMAYGLGFGSSTVSALVSRGSLEIKKLALMLGGKEKTFGFGGQSAMGDIMTSCFGPTRNREFGQLIVSEGSVKKALQAMQKKGKLVEGYFTSRAIYEFAREKNIEMPIQQQVFQIL